MCEKEMRIALLLMFFCPTLWAQNFERTTWGMTLIEVERTENLKLTYVGKEGPVADAYAHKGWLYGKIPVVRHYNFRDGRLFAASYFIDTTEDYLTVIERLRGSYGDPDSADEDTYNWWYAKGSSILAAFSKDDGIYAIIFVKRSKESQ